MKIKVLLSLLKAREITLTMDNRKPDLSAIHALTVRLL